MLIKLGKLLQSKFAIIAVTVLLITWLGAAFAVDQRSLFLPGETSNGHVLFETSCKSCHEGFKPVSNETCNRCHEAEMAKDVHGEKKFRDPRWAELRENLDVLTCTACHEEHVHMFGRGVHLQPDLCMACHQGVIEGELVSHDGFTPDGCWTGGCHNYHDHRSISTGFLRKNMGEPWILPEPGLPSRTVEAKLDEPPEADLIEAFLKGAG